MKKCSCGETHSTSRLSTRYWFTCLSCKSTLLVWNKPKKEKPEPRYRLPKLNERIEIIARAKDLKRKGYSMIDISRALNVSYKTVRTALDPSAPSTIEALKIVNNEQNKNRILPMSALLMLAVFFFVGCGDDVRLKKTEYLVQGQWLHCSEVEQNSCGSTLVCGERTFQCQTNLEMRLR